MPTDPLTVELGQYVLRKVREGASATPDEYVRDLVRAHRRAEGARDATRRALDAALASGIADAEAGRVVEAGEAFSRVRAALGATEGDAPA